MIKNFIAHPELFYPEIENIVDVIKWHVSLTGVIDKKREELCPDLHTKAVVTGADLIGETISAEIRSLVTRDRSFFSMLKYEEMILVETAMLIGRELWYRKLHGFSDYDEELASTDLTDLDAWAEVFSIPPTEKEGGNLDACIDYTLSKRVDFLQSYIDALEAIYEEKGRDLGEELQELITEQCEQL